MVSRSALWIPYYLSYCPRGFKPVPSIFDAPGNGLVLKYGLVYNNYSIEIKEEDENDVTTDSGIDFE